MTIKEAYKELNKSIDYNESSILLQFVLNCNKNFLVENQDKEILTEEAELIEQYKKELESGKPLQYITNYQYFFGNKFYVDENVLIPQPDTEVLVEKAIEIIKNENIKTVLDLCTGSGAIAISIKKQISEIDMYASDISEGALSIAKKNSESLLKEGKISFIKSDMFKNIDRKFDMIISNPPYIKTDIIKALDKQVQNEPRNALDGGKDGLSFYRAIKSNVNNYLNNVLLLEIGYDQKNEVLNIFENGKCYKDYGNNDRIIEWRI